MVDSRFLITISNVPDRRRRSANLVMAENSGARQAQMSKKQAAVGPSLCQSSHGAAVDAVVLVVVLFAFGFLLVPYLRLFFHILDIAGSSVLVAMKDESLAKSMVCLLVVLSFFVLSLVGVGLFLCAAGGRKCGNPSCRGLRSASELDVKIETEELMKSSDSSEGSGGGSGLLFFDLNEPCHRYLEAELRKMAPPRGRAILLFQEKCGCPVGRLVVNGPRRLRKLRK